MNLPVCGRARVGLAVAKERANEGHSFIPSSALPLSPHVLTLSSTHKHTHTCISLAITHRKYRSATFTQESWYVLWWRLTRGGADRGRGRPQHGVMTEMFVGRGMGSMRRASIAWARGRVECLTHAYFECHGYGI